MDSPEEFRIKPFLFGLWLGRVYGLWLSAQLRNLPLHTQPVNIFLYPSPLRLLKGQWCIKRSDILGGCLAALRVMWKFLILLWHWCLLSAPSEVLWGAADYKDMQTHKLLTSDPPRLKFMKQDNFDASCFRGRFWPSFVFYFNSRCELIFGPESGSSWKRGCKDFFMVSK